MSQGFGQGDKHSNPNCKNTQGNASKESGKSTQNPITGLRSFFLKITSTEAKVSQLLEMVREQNAKLEELKASQGANPNRQDMTEDGSLILYQSEVGVYHPEKDLRELREENEKLKAELDQKGIDYRKLEESLTGATKGSSPTSPEYTKVDVSHLETELARYKEENQKLVHDVAETSRAGEQEVSQLLDKEAEYEKRLGEMQEASKEKDALVLELQAKLAEKTEANETLKAQYEQARTDEEKWKSSYHTLTEETESKNAGVSTLLISYGKVAEALGSCDSTKDLMQPFLPFSQMSNQISFVGFVGHERSLALSVYNGMKRKKVENPSPWTEGETAMITAINDFYKGRDGLDYDILLLPEVDGQFHKNKVQDLEKPSNVAFRQYEAVYVPMLMKDDKVIQFKGCVKGK